MFPIGARTIYRDGTLGLEVLTCSWLGRAGDPSSILSVKQRRYTRHPLMHMGNTKVKYSTTFYTTKLCYYNVNTKAASNY